MTANTNLVVAAFPSTAAELLQKRISARKASLIDAVETALVRHVEDVELQRLLQAVNDDESVSGKWKEDNFLAARRLQELAASEPIIANEKMTAVQRAMNVVLRRFNLGADQRRAAIPAPAAE